MSPRPSTPLNVLYVGTLPPHPGGSAILASQLLSGLASTGHRIRALAPAPPTSPVRADHPALYPPGIAVARFRVPRSSTAYPGGSTHPAYRRAEREGILRALPPLIAADRPDVLIVGRESVAWHVLELTSRLGIPSVLIAQGGTTYVRLVATGGPLTVRLLRDQLRKVDWIVAVAAHLAHGLRSLGLDRVSVIPNPVDLARFAPAARNAGLLRRLAIAAEDVVVLHVSNLRALKRPLDIVDSAEISLRRNRRLLYLIVGDGPCRAEMEQACRRKRIADRFRFAGWVAHHRVAEYLNLAEMVVMPSETEAQSLVYLETQACARALLASDIPAAREVIADGEDGLLFRMGDVGDLAEKTLRVAGDPAVRAALGRVARERVRPHAVERVVDLYAETLAAIARRRPGSALDVRPAAGRNGCPDRP